MNPKSREATWPIFDKSEVTTVDYSIRQYIDESLLPLQEAG